MHAVGDEMDSAFGDPELDASRGIGVNAVHAIHRREVREAPPRNGRVGRKPPDDQRRHGPAGGIRRRRRHGVLRHEDGAAGEGDRPCVVFVRAVAVPDGDAVLSALRGDDAAGNRDAAAVAEAAAADARAVGSAPDVKGPARDRDRAARLVWGTADAGTACLGLLVAVQVEHPVAVHHEALTLPHADAGGGCARPEHVRAGKRERHGMAVLDAQGGQGVVLRDVELEVRDRHGAVGRRHEGNARGLAAHDERPGARQGELSVSVIGPAVARAVDDVTPVHRHVDRRRPHDGPPREQVEIADTAVLDACWRTVGVVVFRAAAVRPCVPPPEDGRFASRENGRIRKFRAQCGRLRLRGPRVVEPDQVVNRSMRFGVDRRGHLRNPRAATHVGKRGNSGSAGSTASTAFSTGGIAAHITEVHRIIPRAVHCTVSSRATRAARAS